MLNYLYALLEAETTTALNVLGLDPTLGVVHADHRDRDSLALDVMETVRPAVDRRLLDLFETRTFQAADFYETRKGVCRILTPLTHTLADTALLWAEMVTPVAERAAVMLAEAPGARIARSLTPLTSATRRSANGGSTPASAARLPKRCKRCGSPVPHKKRKLCDDCYAAFKTEQGVKRRCKSCGERVPHRHRVYCDSCLPGVRPQ